MPRRYPVYSDTVSLNLESIEPCLAGPKRPQDRVLLGEMKAVFDQASSGILRRQNPAPWEWWHHGSMKAAGRP